MKLELLQMPKKQAEEEYQAYVKALEQKKFENLQYLQQLKTIYSHLRHGKKIIDAYQAFKKEGLNADGDPLIAICRADSKTVHFTKMDKGAGKFSYTERWKSYADDVILPEQTYPSWLNETVPDQWVKGGYITRVKNERLQAPVPLIPARLLPNGSLERYHILWEVEKWKPEPPRDPILLRRLSGNLFVVLATWDLTEIERTVMRGSLR
jgi:hypothetical protein